MSDEKRSVDVGQTGKAVSNRGLSIALQIFVCGALTMNTQAAEGNDIRDPRFSPDSKSMVFDRCSPDYPDRCRINIYNMETGELGYFLPPAGQTWMQAYYSDQGDKIVFVTMPAGDRNRDLFSQREEVFPQAQIAVMNADGSNVRILTNTVGYKGMPAFSHSGKKVVFAQAEKLRDSGATVAAFWDLWELDLETGAIGLFAGRFRFYRIGLSTYFPGDQKVLMNGYGPISQIGSANGLAPSIREYEQRYNRSAVLEVIRGQATLNAPLFSKFVGAQRATLDNSGNINFIADGGPVEGLRIRQTSPDGQFKSWNFPHISSVWGASVSGSGQFFVMSATRSNEKKNHSELMLLDTANGTWKNIQLPQQGKQVNR